MTHSKSNGPVVSVLVWNDFCNDARVLKESETLQFNGYTVYVNALHTPGKTAVYETLETGITIVRCGFFPRVGFLSGKMHLALDGKSRILNIFRFITLIIVRLVRQTQMAFNVIRQCPKIIHANDVDTLPLAWFCSILAGAKLIYDAHEISTSREGYRVGRKLVGMVEKILVPRTNGMITTTDTRAKFFARAYHVARPVVLQNRPRLVSVNGDDRIRRELSLVEPYPIVIYQGGLQPGRGLDLLIKAATNLERTYVVFIGGGSMEAELKALVTKLRLEHRVWFIPTVPLTELPSYTASADIGVQPIENTCLNHFSTDSNKLFEYAMAGLPVVASSLPEIRSLVSKYRFGELVPSGDSELLAAAIQKLVDRPDIRDDLAYNAKLAAGSLNWESQEAKLVMLYQSIINA